MFVVFPPNGYHWQNRPRHFTGYACRRKRRKDCGIECEWRGGMSVPRPDGRMEIMGTRPRVENGPGERKTVRVSRFRCYAVFVCKNGRHPGPAWRPYREFWRRAHTEIHQYQ